MLPTVRCSIGKGALHHGHCGQGDGAARDQREKREHWQLMTGPVQRHGLSPYGYGQLGAGGRSHPQSYWASREGTKRYVLHGIFLRDDAYATIATRVLSTARVYMHHNKTLG